MLLSMKCGELGLGQRPYLLRLDVAVLEKHECRYCADSVLLRDFLVSSTLTLATLSLPSTPWRPHRAPGRSPCTDRTIPPNSPPARDVGLQDFGSKVASLTWWMNSFIASSADGNLQRTRTLDMFGREPYLQGYANGISRQEKREPVCVRGYFSG